MDIIFICNQPSAKSRVIISKKPAQKLIIATFLFFESASGISSDIATSNIIPEANDSIYKKLNERKVDLQNKKLATERIVRQEYESAPIGFLQELEALIKIIIANPVALGFYIVLFLFLMLLEMLIVLSKRGDENSDYDLIVQHQQRIKAETLKRMEEGLLSKGNSKKALSEK